MAIDEWVNESQHAYVAESGINSRTYQSVNSRNVPIAVSARVLTNQPTNAAVAQYATA